MLTFLAEYVGTSNVVGLEVGVASLVRYHGSIVPGFAPGLTANTLLTPTRSLVDRLASGPRRMFGDRSCTNYQLKGVVRVKSAVTGDSVASWNPSYGIPSDQYAQPSSTTGGYSIEQLQKRFGPVWSSSHKVYWRTGCSGFTLKSIPSLPLMVGDSAVSTSFAGLNGRGDGFYTMQESCSSTRTFHVGSDGARAIYSVFVFWTRKYNSAGILVSSTGSAQSQFVYAGPSATGKSDQVVWYTSPNGMWTRSPYTPVLPPSLESFTRSDFEAFMANPASTTAWIPPGQAYMHLLPSWTSSTCPPSYYNGRYTVTSPDWFDFRDAMQISIRNYFSEIMPILTSNSGVDDWHELGDTAVDNIVQTSVNHYENASQLKTIFGTFRASLKLWHNVGDPKAWAKWWLSLRFGDRLLFNDIVSTSNSVLRNVKDRTRGWKQAFYYAKSQSHTTIASPSSRVPPARVDHYLKLYYKFKDIGWFGKAYTFGRTWALWPTTAAGWDLVPFSFVVDWFVDIQSIFEEFDRDTYVQYLDVCSVIVTEKKTYDFDDIVFDDFVLSDAQITCYTRNLRSSLPSGPFRIDRGHSSAINVVDGISLIVQAH